MPRIDIAFVWHMHQPFYKDLGTGQYQLPWTRLHALKDYYGMVQALTDFPEIRQTFNLVPSMLVQIEEYASGAAADPFLDLALKPAEDLSPAERDLILRYFFQANVSRIINRYPRYAELYESYKAANRSFTPGALRDLQVLSQLAWFDEEFLSRDPEAGEIVRKGRDYSLADQQWIGRKQREILGRVLPVYRDFAARGQIELSTTPFYHPILPLLCDSDIARVSHPNLALPRRFAHPEDAQVQIERARRFMQQRFGVEPAGMWPSEGSVSDDALALIAGAGFRWAATDNGVLAATLGRAAGPAETYQPYLWRQDSRELRLIFRDHYLSDLIGFVYSKMDAAEAAEHFLARIRENCAPILAAGRDAFVPVILDGENAWEYYEQNGRPFLRELYARITADPQLAAVTVSEGLARASAAPLGHIFPASWINTNFDIWIGAEEDNRAWDLLSAARDAYAAAAPQLPATQREPAYEELLIAEGSDWCWWYGPEHHSDNRAEFDQLFRGHLAMVYRALGVAPPEALSRPVLSVAETALNEPPTAALHPAIDGEVTSYFEWMGAGLYAPDTRQGAMHGRLAAPVARELRYGADGAALVLRLDFTPAAEIPGLEVRVTAGASAARICLASESAVVVESSFAAPVACAWRHILELRLPGAAAQPFQLSLWRDGLPLESLPANGTLRAATV